MNQEKIYNNSVMQSRRRELRRDQTDTEKLLWWQLRARQMLGMKFFRQYSIGKYILDFYCPKVRLAIELDGGQHNKDMMRLKDEERTCYIEDQDIRVIRFWNNDLTDNLTGVLEKILTEIQQRKDCSDS